MTDRIALAPEDWIEKRFNFDYPIGASPAILERVRGTPARLEELIRGIPAELLTRRIGDAWSIQEHAGHLISLEALHIGRLDDYDAGLETLRAADMSNKKTYEADYNQGDIAGILARFRAGRMEFVARFEAMDEAQVARSAIHPRLQKPMRVIDLALFTADHDDHHLASITHLAHQLNSAG